VITALHSLRRLALRPPRTTAGHWDRKGRMSWTVFDYGCVLSLPQPAADVAARAAANRYGRLTPSRSRTGSTAWATTVVTSTRRAVLVGGAQPAGRPRRWPVSSTGSTSRAGCTANAYTFAIVGTTGRRRSQSRSVIEYPGIAGYRDGSRAVDATVSATVLQLPHSRGKAGRSRYSGTCSTNWARPRPQTTFIDDRLGKRGCGPGARASEHWPFHQR